MHCGSLSVSMRQPTRYWYKGNTRKALFEIVSNVTLHYCRNDVQLFLRGRKNKGGMGMT